MMAETYDPLDWVRVDLSDCAAEVWYRLHADLADNYPIGVLPCRLCGEPIYECEGHARDCPAAKFERAIEEYADAIQKARETTSSLQPEKQEDQDAR